MKKIIFLLLTVVFLFSNKINAQLGVNFSGGSGSVGSTVDVDVTVDNFDEIVLMQWSINWDSMVMTFNSIQNVTSTLPQFTEAGSIGTPVSAVTLDEGEITVSWSKTNTEPESLPDGHLLFTIRFDMVGAPCDETDVDLSNTPTVIEVIDEDFNSIGAVSNPGNVAIPGSNCGGSTDLTLTGSMETGNSGTAVCIEVTAENFVDIQSAQFGLEWDPGVLTYTGMQNVALPGYIVNAANAPTGSVDFLWFDGTGVTPVTLNDGDLLLEVCFTAVGSPASMTDIDFIDLVNSNIEFTDSQGTVLPYELNSGKFTTSGTGNNGDFTLIALDNQIQMGEQVCSPIAVQNFDDIQSMQFAIQWDDSVLSYTGVQNFSGLLQPFDGTNVNQTAPDVLRVSWNLLTGGVTVPDDHTIFEICFEGIGDCEETTDINFTDDPPIFIEISNGDNEVVPYNLVSGEIEIICECSISLFNMENPTCAGACDGILDVNLSGGSGNFTCEWTDEGTGMIFSNDCDQFMTLCAGTYTLEISDGGSCNTSMTFTLTEPDPLTASGVVTNETDDCDGSITVSPSGGNGGYTYVWDDGPTTKDRANLCKGEYCVTVFDVNMCESEKQCFTIDPKPLAVDAAETVNLDCNGDADGSICLTVSGGCPDPSYTYEWDGPPEGAPYPNSNKIDGLTAGMYTVTISDDSTPPLEVVQSYPITEPMAIGMGTVVTASSGNDGAIDLTVMGGVGTITYLWDPNGEMTEDLTDLAPGKYSVTVTDENMCTNVLQDICVDWSYIDVQVEDPNANPDFNGFGVACNGDCTATIEGLIEGGNGVVTLTVNGDPATFPLTDLCAGEYTIVATDESGLMDTEVVTILEPDALEISLDSVTLCSNGDDGSIEVSVSGGVVDYSYTWSTGDTTANISSLDEGSYTLLVTDANGCEAMLQDVVIEECIVDENCFEGGAVITPNDDGYNDFFLISCATSNNGDLCVYDRWGRTVYTQDNYDNTWAGTHTDGTNLQEGGYMWVFKVTNEDETVSYYKGTVSIVRDNF